MKELGWVGHLILIAGFLLTGFGIGVAFWGFSEFQPRKELDPVSLVQLGMTLLVGFYVTQTVARRVAVKGVERGILTDAIKDFLLAAKDTLESYGVNCDEACDQAKLKPLLRRCNALGSHSSNLELLLKECEIPGDSPMKDAVNVMLRFRKLATQTLPTAPEPAEQAATEGAYRELRLALARLIMFISRDH